MIRQLILRGHSAAPCEYTLHTTHTSLKPAVSLWQLACLIYLLVSAAGTSYAAPQSSLQIMLDGVPRTLLLTPRNMEQYHVTLPADAHFYSGRLSDDPEVSGRVSFIDGIWQGLLLNHGQVQVLDTASSAIQVKALSIDNMPGQCGRPPHLATPVSQSFTTRQLTSAQLTSEQANTQLLTSSQLQISNFASYCDDALKVDGVCLVAELTMSFDTDFKTKFGSSYEAQAVAILDNVDFLYEKQFAIKFKRLQLSFGSGDMFDGSTVTEDVSPIEKVLYDMVDKRFKRTTASFDPNPRAIMHLVTGKNYLTDTDPAIGVANFPVYNRTDGSSTYPTPVTPVLCSYGGASGLSQIIGSGGNRAVLTSIVVAHEIGHNFGFDHDGQDGSYATGCSPTQYIMAAQLAANATEFSSCSAEAIGPNIQQLNPVESCFDFPYDAAITKDSSNPTNADAGTGITTAYAIEVKSRSDRSMTIQLTGAITSSAATISSATLDNNIACSLNGSKTSYSCSFTPGSSDSIHSLNLTLNTALSNLTLQHSVATSTPNLDDIDQSNNQLTEVITVAGGTGTTTVAETTHAKDSGGGGGALGWSGIGLLLLLLGRRRRQA